MPTGSPAETFRLYFDDDATPTPAKTLVEGIESLTVSPGRTLENVVAKDTIYPWVNDAGFTASATMVREVPSGAGQDLLFATHDAKTPRRCYLESTTTGGDTWSGDAYVAIESFDSPARGVNQFTISINFVGEPTRGVAA